MATYQRGKYWWYRFRFAGERIDEPTKSTSRTVAKEAERQHRRSLEDGFNNFKEVRQNRIRVLEEIIDEYLAGYRLRYRSASFAVYALGHVARLLGTKKPAASKKPDPPQTASLFDFGTPAPAASSDADAVNDEEDEIMAEIEAEDADEESPIAA